MTGPIWRCSAAVSVAAVSARQASAAGPSGKRVPKSFRLALIPIIFSMCVAFVVVHRGQPFAAKELAFIYLVIFVVLFVAGAGRYSLDNIIATLLHKENVANNIKVENKTTPHPQGSEHLTGDAPRQ